MEIQYRKFLENQEKNFQKFTKILDKFANKTKNQSSLYRKCQEFKKRGELSIKFLKEKEDLNEFVLTQRRLPPNVQVSSQTLPPPPSSKRSSKSSFTYCESPDSGHIVEKPESAQRMTEQKETVPKQSSLHLVSPLRLEQPVRIEITQCESLSVLGHPKNPALPSMAMSPQRKNDSENKIQKTESNRLSNSVSLKSSCNHSARYNERWKEPVMQINSPAQAVYRPFEYTSVDRKLKTIRNPFKKTPDLLINSDLLEKSLEEKLTSLLPQINGPSTPKVFIPVPSSPKNPDLMTTPSLNIRILSHGTQLLSSEVEDGVGLRESLNSQILIKDEVVSRFKEEEDEESLSNKPSKPSFEKPEKLDHFEYYSPSKEYDSIDVLRLNSPHAEETLATIVQTPFQQPARKTTPEKPSLEDYEEREEAAKVGEAGINFTALTVEDKSYAIADFILENLILEVFTSSLHIKERLIGAYRKIMNFKGIHQINEMSKYLSQIFSIINDSPEEQLDIYMKLNLPIIHSDIKRLMLASPLMDSADHMELSVLPYESVLNIQLYIKLEEDLRDSEYLSMGMSPQEIERSHIFHKLIFDALNEKLDYERIGGLKPILPTFFASYKPEPPITPDYCAVILEQSKKDVIEWSLEKIGLLPENLWRDPAIEDGSDETLESLREDALQKHLNAHVVSIEEKWQDFSDEYLEVFLNLSDYVFDSLVEGVVTSIISIKESKSRTEL